MNEYNDGRHTFGTTAHLMGFASIPAFKRFIASSVLPMLFVQTYAMYLIEQLSFNRAIKAIWAHQISPKKRMRMTALR